MPIKESTIKRLFALSRNKCANPDCYGPLVIDGTVVGEICHIRARRKGGARYDPSLTAAEKDAIENLVLLCSTCHKLVDGQPSAYPLAWLAKTKCDHEQRANAPLEISQSDARYAAMILEKHIVRTQKGGKKISSTVSGSVKASASAGGVSIAIGGPNEGTINVNMPAPKRTGTPYPANSIGADANMTNFVEYLCGLYVDYMALIEPNKDLSWAILGRHIKSKFRLKKKTRNHLSAERFPDLVNYLIYEKLAKTPVGRKHRSNGTKLCRTFDEFRHGQM